MSSMRKGISHIVLHVSYTPSNHLRAHVEYRDNGSDEDEPKTAVDPGRHSCVYWKSNMIEHRSSRVKDQDEAAEKSSDEGCDDDGPPGKSYRV